MCGECDGGIQTVTTEAHGEHTISPCVYCGESPDDGTMVTRRDPQVISFLALMELIAINRLRDNGVSLQRIRKLHADWASLGLRHPFANRIVLEAIRDNEALPDEAREAIADFMSELDFGEGS